MWNSLINHMVCSTIVHVFVYSKNVSRVSNNVKSLEFEITDCDKENMLENASG